MVDRRQEPRWLPDQAIELPRFELPFPSHISAFADSVIEHTSGWALASGLIHDERAVERLRRNGIMHAGPRLVPTAPPEAAFLVCDWTVFLIVLDDEFDDGRELGARPELAEPAIEDVIASFRDEAPGRASRFPGLGGIGQAVADLGRRFEQIATGQEWLRRFRRHAEEHLWSKVTEARQRSSGTTLDVPSYIDLRRVTGAPYTYSDLVEAAEGVLIAEEVRESHVWGRTLDAFADVWLGIQDICSCAKEVAAGDELNLAAVMARSEGSPLQQGIDNAYRWVCVRSDDFAAQRAQLAELASLLGLDREAEMDITRYVDALDRLLGGHLAWNSQENPRYTQIVSRA